MQFNVAVVRYPGGGERFYHTSCETKEEFQELDQQTGEVIKFLSFEGNVAGILRHIYKMGAPGEELMEILRKIYEMGR